MLNYHFCQSRKSPPSITNLRSERCANCLRSCASWEMDLKTASGLDHMRIKFGLIVSICIIVCSTSLVTAQQKGQYVLGQYGLNAGVAPDPGFTFASLTINYSADSLKDSNGNSVQGITGNYGFWGVENHSGSPVSRALFGVAELGERLADGGHNSSAIRSQCRRRGIWPTPRCSRLRVECSMNTTQVTRILERQPSGHQD